MVAQPVPGRGRGKRYEVAQGFGPKVRRLTAPTLQEVLDRAASIMGSEAADIWDSDAEAAWDAPHSVWAAWA